MKKRVRNYIDQQNDATNARELYQAMVSGGPPLNGISVHQVSLNNPTPQTNKPKIAGISNYYDFEFDDAANMRAYKYYGIFKIRFKINFLGIGDGIVFPSSTFQGKENSAWLHVFNEDGATADSYAYDNTVNFWVWSSYMEGPINKEPLPPENPEEYQDPETDTTDTDDDSIYEDDNESCGATFKTFDEVLRHINFGRHKKALQLYKASTLKLAFKYKF